MFSDSIADMLTRIRNGYMSKKETVTIPYSKVKEAIAQVLMKNGYLKEVTVKEEKQKKDLVVTLLYVQDKPSLTAIQRVSKSGRRVYEKKGNLPYVLSGFGKAIVSTSVGIMTADEARKKSLGGEIICRVW